MILAESRDGYGLGLYPLVGLVSGVGSEFSLFVGLVVSQIRLFAEIDAKNDYSCCFLATGKLQVFLEVQTDLRQSTCETFTIS